MFIDENIVHYRYLLNLKIIKIARIFSLESKPTIDLKIKMYPITIQSGIMYLAYSDFHDSIHTPVDILKDSSYSYFWFVVLKKSCDVRPTG